MYSKEHHLSKQWVRVNLVAVLTQGLHGRFAQDGPQTRRGAGAGGRGIVPWSGCVRLETRGGWFVVLHLKEKPTEFRKLRKEVRQHTSTQEGFEGNPVLFWQTSYSYEAINSTVCPKSHYWHNGHEAHFLSFPLHSSFNLSDKAEGLEWLSTPNY